MHAFSNVGGSSLLVQLVEYPLGTNMLDSCGCLTKVCEQPNSICMLLTFKMLKVTALCLGMQQM